MIVAMTRSQLTILCAALAGASLLSGCDTLQPLISPSKPAAQPTKPAAGAQRPGASTAAPAQTPVANADQAALKDGIELYNRGAYNEAIKRLAAPEIAAGPKAGQLQALKYTAFSYCVTSRQTLCRQTFEKAFKIDPAFDLLPGENGHPLWGPAFARAKKAK
jgi:hypothetical protein